MSYSSVPYKISSDGVVSANANDVIRHNYNLLQYLAEGEFEAKKKKYRNPEKYLKEIEDIARQLDQLSEENQ